MSGDAPVWMFGLCRVTGTAIAALDATHPKNRRTERNAEDDLYEAIGHPDTVTLTGCAVLVGARTTLACTISNPDPLICTLAHQPPNLESIPAIFATSQNVN